MLKHSFVRTITAFSLAVLFIFSLGATARAESISDLKAEVTALEEEEEQICARLVELKLEEERLQLLAETQKDEIVEASAGSLDVYMEYAKNMEAIRAAEAERKALEAEAEALAQEQEAARAAVEIWYDEYDAAVAAAKINAGNTANGYFIWPVPGYDYISCWYGCGHRGIDIAGHNIYGEPIVAADGGTVIASEYMSSYGYCVVIDHGNGWVTRYAHASELNCSVGDVVTQGQTIAYVGSSGYSTGPHLHFEIMHDDVVQNPFDYLNIEEE